MFSEQLIIQNLNNLHSKGEFISKRYYFRKIQDFSPFISSNILAILDHCKIADKQLLKNIDITKDTIKRYQKDHLTYMWPIINGKSRIDNSLILKQFDFLTLSPDADCTCMQQIALQEQEMIEKIIDELTFYRLDNKIFRLPHYQQKLPYTHNIFLTWFPPRQLCKKRKMENIDITVNANILWFLGQNNHLDIPGSHETINFIKAILSTDLILTKSFELSPYYPYPLIILYFISRAIHWGRISELYDCESQIIQLANKVKPTTSLDYLLLASIGCFWKDSKLFQNNLEKFQEKGIQPNPFFIAPFVLPAVQDLPFFYKIAKLKFSSIRFTSDAFQWTLLLWLIQQIKKG